MLVLSRRIGESIVIGDDVYCTILKYKPEHGIQIGFCAPKNLPIHRHEIFKLINEKKRQNEVEYMNQDKDSVIDRLIAQFKS